MIVDIKLQRGTMTVVVTKGSDLGASLREAIGKVPISALATVTRTNVVYTTESQERAWRESRP